MADDVPGAGWLGLALVAGVEEGAIMLKLPIEWLWWFVLYTPGGYVIYDIDKPKNVCEQYVEEYNHVYPNPKHPAFCMPKGQRMSNYIPKRGT